MRKPFIKCIAKFGYKTKKTDKHKKGGIAEILFNI